MAVDGSQEELDALDHGIAALEEQRDALGDAVVDTALRPLLERRRRLTAQPGDRRKLVTVLVSDLVDSTPLTATLGDEAMRELMGRYFALWRDAVRSQGGEVEKFIGDAVVGVFGMDRAREDDPHRAVRAAVAVRPALARLAEEVLAEHGCALRTRVGIDTGEAVLGRFDEWGDGDLVVVGGTVNRAARLQAAAPPDAILLSAATARHVRGSFGLQDHGELRLRGVDRPVRTFVVHSATEAGFWSTARGLEGVSTRTVGRDVELQLLTKLYADAVDERTSTVVTVVGDAGIGKSRLLADFEAWLAGLPEPAWLLRGRSDPAEECVPHAVLRSAFAERFGIRDTDPPGTVRARWREGVAAMAPDAVDASEELAAWLGFTVTGPQGAPRSSDPAGLQRRAWGALDTVLRAMTVEAPVVLLLEDLHWAHGPVLDLLQDLQARPRPVPLLVVGTTRPALLEQHPHWGEGLPGHRQVRLHPLSRREAALLVDEVLQRVDTVPGWLRSLVVGAAEGNPFFVEEVIAWLVDSGCIRPGPGRWTVSSEPVRVGAVPGTLRALLEARLDALPAAERDLVDRASVIGRVFWDQAVHHLDDGGGQPSPAVYDALRRREVVHQRPTSAFDDAREFAFRHALLRDVAYDGLLRPRRQRYHARAADWLQRTATATGRLEEHAGAVAHHLLEAGQDQDAVAWLLRAARHAAGSYANEEALDLLRRAAHRCRDEDLLFEVLLEQERVLDRLGRREQQQVVLDRLTGIAGEDPSRCSRALLARGRWLFFHARYADAVPVADEAARLAGSAGLSQVALEARLVAGRSLAFAGEHRDARGHLLETLDLARVAGAPQQVGEALRLLGVVATNLNEEQDAIALLEQSAAAFREAGDEEGQAMVAGQLGAVLMLTGRMAQARRHSEEALAVFTATGHLLRQGIVLGNLSSIALDTGHLDEGLDTARRTLELTESVDDPEGMVSSLQRLGGAERLVGDYEAAEAHLRRAVALGEEHRLHYFVGHALAAWSALDLDRDRPGEALERARSAERAAEASEVPAVLAMSCYAVGLAALAAGDAETAVISLARARDRWRDLALRTESVEAEAALAEALLLAGRPEEALTVAHRAAVAMGPEGPDPTGEPHPGRGLVACARVFAVLDPDRLADTASTADRFLAHRAALIADAEVRDAFLSAPDCRALAALAGAPGAAGTTPARPGGTPAGTEVSS